MNKINNVHDINSRNNSSLRKIWYSFMLATALNIATPGKLQAAENTKLYNRENTEIYYESNIISNITKRTGVELPESYKQKIEEFVKTNEIMNHSDALKFTEDFIVEQMGNDRGISKENQLLFIRSSIHKQATKKYLYNLDDGDDNREEEYENAIDFVIQCGEDYVKYFKNYMQLIISESKMESAQYREETAKINEKIKEMENKIKELEKSTEELRNRNNLTKNRIMQLDTIGIKNMVEFYNLCVSNSDMESNKPNIKKMKDISIIFIQDCKEYGVDYKAIFLEQLGDKKKVEDLLKFYEIE